MKLICIAILFAAFAGSPQPADHQQTPIAPLTDHSLHQANSEPISLSPSADSGLAEKRKLKSERVMEAIKNQRKAELKSLLSGEQTVSISEVDALLASIDTHWGPLSESTEVDADVTLNKGDFDFIYHLQLTTTHYGNWYMFSKEQADSNLRIGITFHKANDQVGGVVIALVPK